MTFHGKVLKATLDEFRQATKEGRPLIERMMHLKRLDSAIQNLTAATERLLAHGAK